jgi:hypothetical protein
MYYGIILNVGIISNPYIMNITPKYSSVPYTTIVSNYHITNNDRSFGQKAVVAKFRSFA